MILFDDIDLYHFRYILCLSSWKFIYRMIDFTQGLNRTLNKNLTHQPKIGKIPIASVQVLITLRPITLSWDRGIIATNLDKL
ncbi:MAG: hypothetical protein VKK42_22495 [Lyngbya sp.]|nr:hypothetical protein [Lyngbya sp.]